jgi:hypothetical protein
MDGEHTREFHMSRLAVALAAIALLAAVLAPTAGATSPSQDQYGSALPGVGNDNGGGNTGGSNPGDSGGQSTIPVAPPSSSGTQKSNASNHSGNGGHSKSDSKGGSSHKDKGNGSNGNSNKSQHPVAANPAGQSVPHIAADSAGDGWVPWFIAGLLALAAAGGILVYRNRRRAAQS